jgi:hypothetical protein
MINLRFKIHTKKQKEVNCNTIKPNHFEAKKKTGN